MCQHQKDHETGWLFYRHVCVACFAVGKKHRHMSKDCREKGKKHIGHCHSAVQEVVNKNKNVKKFVPRIVGSKMINNGVSVNWRAEWARFAGKTYMKVLQMQRKSNLFLVLFKFQSKTHWG